MVKEKITYQNGNKYEGEMKNDLRALSATEVLYDGDLGNDYQINNDSHDTSLNSNIIQYFLIK